MNTPMILAAREGFHVPGAESFYNRPLVHLSIFGVDASINRTVILLFVATALVGGLFLAAFRKPRLVPSGLQNVMEYGVDFVRNQVVLPTMGQQGMSYLPYLSVLFFFIFFCNIFGAIPGINFPITSRIAIPLVLAVGTWLIFIAAGIRAQGFGHYFKNSVMPPGVPPVLYIILIPIEFLSTFILRPATLTIRLTANMIAGHLLLVVFFLGTTYLFGRGLTFGFGFGSLIAGTMFIGFEMFVAGLQAFVFTILTAVYIKSSVEAAH
jgi:F-type H+-transporting ATPase subunit a